ncbi:MAG: indole-3-glycerol phosphate synthase TrpC [Candidatus Omnitrophota bacterium]
MHKILNRIIKNKKKELCGLKKITPLGNLIAAAKFIELTGRFKKVIAKPGLTLIAEIKKKSPRHGILRVDFNPVSIAKTYQQHGAGALSVLTNDDFAGKLEHIRQIKAYVHLPILRKDLIIDEYQIYESSIAGADAILLIAAILPRRILKKFLQIAKGLSLDTIVEVHTERDVAKIKGLDYDIVGINNRNLNNFSLDLNVTKNLLARIEPHKLIVSESGINTHEQINVLRTLKVNAVLIGEAFMQSCDIGQKIAELMGTGYGQG